MENSTLSQSSIAIKSFVSQMKDLQELYNESFVEALLKEIIKNILLENIDTIISFYEKAKKKEIKEDWNGNKIIFKGNILTYRHFFFEKQCNRLIFYKKKKVNRKYVFSELFVISDLRRVVDHTSEIRKQDCLILLNADKEHYELYCLLRSLVFYIQTF